MKKLITKKSVYYWMYLLTISIVGQVLNMKWYIYLPFIIGGCTIYMIAEIYVDKYKFYENSSFNFMRKYHDIVRFYKNPEQSIIFCEGLEKTDIIRTVLTGQVAMIIGCLEKENPDKKYFSKPVKFIYKELEDIITDTVSK